MKKITIYSKPCFDCVYEKEAITIKSWAIRSGLDVKYYRTEYNPIYHKMAQKYMKEYRAFVVFEDKALEIKEMVEAINKGEIDELLGLSETKDAVREASVELSEAKTKPTTKKRAKRTKKVGEKN